MLLLLLVIATLFGAVFLLLPFVSVRDVWSVLPRKRTSATYFAALGLGFMFFEITLIQKLVLFLGYPTYSLTVTLASILIFTGVGALLSGRFASRPACGGPAAPAAIVALTALYLFVLPAHHGRVAELAAGGPGGRRLRRACAARRVPRHVHAAGHRHGRGALGVSAASTSPGPGR